MISELSGAELKKTLNEILNEMDKHDFKNMNNSKPKKKTYCIAITTKDKMCRNYAWSKCEEQLCYSHRNLVGTEPENEEEEEKDINEAVESFELEI